MFGVLGLTARGFEYIEFKDRAGVVCSLQQSSVMDDTERGEETPGSSCVWLGQGDNRMHLDREAVKELTKWLNRWLEHGSFL